MQAEARHLAESQNLEYLWPWQDPHFKVVSRRVPVYLRIVHFIHKLPQSSIRAS